MVDNALALQIRPYQTPNLAQMYGQVQDIQMNRMRMAEAEEVNRERNALRELVASGVDVNTPDGLNQLRQRAPLLARTTERENLDMAQARAQAQTATIQAFRSMLPGVRDQAGYTAWRAGAVQAMPQFASMIPERYSPDTVLRLAEGADGLVRRMTRQPDEFTRAAIAAGIQPGTPEFQAFAQQRLQRMAAGDRAPPGLVAAAPGSTLVDPRTGEVRFTAPERTTERDRRIDDIVATHRVDRATASGIVDGILQVVPGSAGELPVLLNRLTQEMIPLRMAGEAPPAAAATAAAPPAAAPPAAAATAAAPAAAPPPAPPAAPLISAAEPPRAAAAPPRTAAEYMARRTEERIRRAEEEARAQTRGRERGQADVAREQEQRDLARVTQEIDRILQPGGLLERSTGSGVGRLVDIAGEFIGRSTEGAQAAAALAPIADMVLKLVPRFEGPQSDRDTASYQAAAGRLADSSLTAATRRAAAQEILRIMRARQNQFGAATGAATAAPPIGTVEDGFEFLGGNPADQRNWRRR
jgi:hypothetical protein